ncbi:MAG: WD40 repeat domain-containing protein, partial [Acidobacteria bacterium]|nr:WD40 repeat domain-containing protein [Acidobacteriota bacterium]
GMAECVRTLAGLSSVVWGVVYSRNEKKILSASWDHTVKEWDAETGKCEKILIGHTFFVNSAVYSPNGEKILSASDDKTIKEWDVKTGECVNTLTGHMNGVLYAVYNPNGEKILSTSDDKTIKEWDAKTGDCLKTLAGHTSAVTSAEYSRDGKKILSASAADDIYIEWDAKTGQCLNIYEKDDPQIIKKFHNNDSTTKLKTHYNKIIIIDRFGKTKKELLNISGLFIHGCSFKNLEKGSQWSEEGLKILRQYGGKTGE